MYADYLAHHGIEVRCESRPEGVELLSNDEHAPAVIVSDMRFVNSAFDGPSFIRLVRECPWAAATSILVVSGYVRESDKRAAHEAGADRYLVEPFSPAALLQEVQIGLREHRCSRRV